MKTPYVLDQLLAMGVAGGNRVRRLLRGQLRDGRHTASDSTTRLLVFWNAK